MILLTLYVEDLRTSMLKQLTESIDYLEFYAFYTFKQTDFVLKVNVLRKAAVLCLKKSEK